MTADLLTLIGRDVHLERVASTNGGEYAGPCPWCGDGGKGERSDRFRCWPEHEGGGRWWCRQCGKSGDAIAYQVERGDLTPAEAGALRRNGGTASGAIRADARRRPPAGPVLESESPSADWQSKAARAVESCEAALWTPSGEKARTWLHARGLVDDTLRAWRIGYQARDGELHGLRVPRGIVIPCTIGGALQYVKVRRPVPPMTGPKYMSVKGGKVGLFGLDHVQGLPAALVCEGELDALLAWQEAADLIDVVAVGAKAAHPSAAHLARLLGAGRWLVALDADADDAAGWWTDWSARVRRVRPLHGNDLTDFHQAGGSLRAWVRHHLDGATLDALEAEADRLAVSLETTDDRLTHLEDGHTLEAAAAEALDRMRDDPAAAAEYATIAERLGWTCWGATWPDWVREVA